MSETFFSDVWYYAEGDKPVGPITLKDLIAILSHISDARNVLVWQHGFPNWKKAETIRELASVIIKPPPITPSIDPPRLRGPTMLTDSENVPNSSSTASYPLHKATIANRVLVGLTVALISCVVWRIYLIQQVLDLVRLYGFGHIPVNQMPHRLIR
jgi:hypothetical protein